MKKLEVGDKLYAIRYWSGWNKPARREIETKRIKKVNKKTIQLSWYENYKVRIDSINKDEWFTSEIKALKNKLRLHKAVKNKEKQVLKEIKSLEIMIKNREKKQQNE